MLNQKKTFEIKKIIRSSCKKKKLTFLAVYGLQIDPLILGVRERNENCEKVYNRIIKLKKSNAIDKL